MGPHDPCLFTRDSLIIVIWVDDILYFSHSDKVNTSFLNEFTNTFAIDDKGKMVWFLGTQVHQEVGMICSQQSKCIEAILDKAGMSDCNPTSLPAVAGTRQSKLDQPQSGSDQAKEMEELHSTYRTLVGSLLYLSVMSRPDITFAVCNLSQFLTNPGMPHWKALKHLLRYLKGTTKVAITYRHVEPSMFRLQGYSDSDWASDSDDRKSVSGQCFVLAPNGPLISWQSKKQACIALSTCEAEYVALSHASQELIFLRGIISDLGEIFTATPIIYCDNQGTVALATSAISNKRSKHIDIRHHFIRNLIDTHQLKVIYVNTAENISDVFTKNLPNPRFRELRKHLMG